jgi:hypothetical protein
MDLSGPGIDVKLKEKKRKKRMNLKVMRSGDQGIILNIKVNDIQCDI